jgi:uncharacterized CHY-type Zn-finger protein
MSMIRRGATGGHIESYSKETEDGAIVCAACSRIIVSSINLEENETCPYCHNKISDELVDLEIAKEV